MRVRRIFCGVEGLLIAGGLIALGWSAFVRSDAALTQRRALRDLAKARAVASTTVEHPDVERRAVEPPAAVERPLPGTLFGELDIPRLHVAEAVLEGSDARTLRRGPGHIEQTSEPGPSGNVGIAGHRDSFFRPLSQVRIGDDIVLSTAHATFRYRVSSLRTVSPEDVSVLDNTSDATLTLVTCYPFWFVGPAPMRFVVQATRTDAM